MPEGPQTESLIIWNPAILLQPHYGLTTRIEESLYGTLMPDTGARNVDSLLNQQTLPVISQQLLTHLAAKQKPVALTSGWREEEGIVMESDNTVTNR